jgi:hypothetical protein
MNSNFFPLHLLSCPRLTLRRKFGAAWAGNRMHAPIFLLLCLVPLSSGLTGEDAEGSPETSPIAQDLHLTLAEGDWWRTSFVSESWSSPLQLSVKVQSSTGCSEGATTDGTCVFGLKLYGSQHGPSASTVRCHCSHGPPPARLLRAAGPLAPRGESSPPQRSHSTACAPVACLTSPIALPGSHDPGPLPRATSRATRAPTTPARSIDYSCPRARSSARAPPRAATTSACEAGTAPASSSCVLTRVRVPAAPPPPPPPPPIVCPAALPRPTPPPVPSSGG